MNEILDLIKNYPINEQKEMINEALKKINKISNLEEIEELGKLINEKVKIGMELVKKDGYKECRKITKITKEKFLYDDNYYYDLQYIEYCEDENKLYIEYNNRSIYDKKDFASWLNNHEIKEDNYIIEKIKEFIEK